MWRYRELMPLFDGERAAHAWRRLDAADPCARGSGATLGLERLFVKDESLNPTNSFKARGLSAAVTTRQVPRRDDAVSPVGRQCRQRDGGVRGARPDCRRRSSCRSDVKVAVHPRVRALRRGRAPGRRPDHRRRTQSPPRRGKPLGWYDVSTLKEPYRIEGKKTMAYELGEQLGWTVPRLDHLSDRRRHRHGRHVEGVRGDGGDRLEARPARGRRWCRCRPSTARRSCARSTRATSDRRCGPMRAPSPTACACPKRSATSSCCAPCARAAAPRSPSAIADMVTGMRELGSRKASAPRRKAARR